MRQGVKWGLFFHHVIFEVKAANKNQQGEIELRAIFSRCCKDWQQQHFNMLFFPDLEMLFGNSFGILYAPSVLCTA